MLWRGTWVLCAMLGIVSLIIITNSAHDPYTGLFVFSICGLLSVLLHELGHAIGAWCVGWRVVVFSVNRAAWHAANRELAWLPRKALREASGFVFATPSNAGVNTHFRRAVIIAGGPLFSLLQAIIGVAAAATIPFQTPLGPIMIDNIVAGLAVQGLAFFLISIVPCAKPRKNDGQMLIDVIHAAREGQPRNSLACMLGLLRQKVRLRDVPQWMVDEANASPGMSHQVRAFLASIEIGRVLDDTHVDASRARMLLDAYHAEHDPNDWLWACDAFLAAVYERDLTRANTMIGHIGEPSALPQMAYAAKAATSMLANDRAAGERFLDQMDDAVARTSPFRDLTFEDIRARIEAIEPRCEGKPHLLHPPSRGT